MHIKEHIQGETFNEAIEARWSTIDAGALAPPVLWMGAMMFKEKSEMGKYVHVLACYIQRWFPTLVMFHGIFVANKKGQMWRITSIHLPTWLKCYAVLMAQKKTQ